MLTSLGAFLVAAVCEIAGCYAVWMWLRLERSPLWLIPGLASLIVFAVVLTRVEADYAGRAFAAYGGIYVVTALVWTRFVEGHRPDGADVLGSLLCVLGAAVILLGRR
jgi:small multidrug resistance family-3 protein